MKKKIFTLVIFSVIFSATYAQTLVTIVSAVAGEENPTSTPTTAAYDNNLSTRWANATNTLSVAWIEFDLGTTAVEMSQAQLSMFKGNARTYPISIDVINDLDTVNVYKGSTTLQVNEKDYQVFNFPTTASGKKVKISLTGENSSGGVYGNFLSIYEIKFYNGGSTSVNNVEESKLNIYPSIIKSGAKNVTISNIADKNLDINVFDLKGVNVYSTNRAVESGVTTFNLNNLSAGTYFIKTKGVTVNTTSKLIVQ